ncbi:MAG: hypothetical protein KC476_11505 [Cyanobacteria bacterium HKST-UBA06]|nr:hypothetical protein [Cyanobacteria bacterium HKST-UBA06]
MSDLMRLIQPQFGGVFTSPVTDTATVNRALKAYATRCRPGLAPRTKQLAALSEQVYALRLQALTCLRHPEGTVWVCPNGFDQYVGNPDLMQGMAFRRHDALGDVAFDQALRLSSTLRQAVSGPAEPFDPFRLRKRLPWLMDRLHRRPRPTVLRLDSSKHSDGGSQADVLAALPELMGSADPSFQRPPCQ